MRSKECLHPYAVVGFVCPFREEGVKSLARRLPAATAFSVKWFLNIFRLHIVDPKNGTMA